MTRFLHVAADSAQRILRFVFAKKDYREGQEQALIHVLQRRDSVVLLPTGAGKSLIYQLAGLILPGRTIIIDPIVALMEDQIEGLREHGIDRALGISGFVTRQGRIDEAFELVSNGAALFLFLSPERLQQREFRQALRELTVGTPVNLAVIDEAHCISEWGHDFRTAYLDLGRNLRELCASVGGDAPPLLALTGTASRAVLRDVLIELEIDRGDPGAIVKPESFDRRELSFEVVMAEVGESHARLAGYMRALPTRPDMYPDGFYEPRGMRSSLGIVFCPHVNGKFGISEVSALLRERDICSHVGLYSGSAPRGFDRRGWEHEKRRNARRFRNGELPVLASTKAFGMGVDVPNIRYTVHFGLPPSIEAFYQEAGRAGRDRREARCAVIFTEASEATTRSMLSEDIDGEQARAAYEGQDRRNNDDDITRQLWFHYGSFPGVDEELDHVDQVLSGLNWNGIQRTLSIPFGGDAKFEKLRERAIHRLSLVGVVGSYLKDWGGKSFEITTTDAAARDLDSAFLDYVARTQPGRLGAYETEVADVAAQSLSDRASKLASMALGLLYDTIEKSRRRALREMANLARDSKGDAEIRQRIEDYFREGDLAPLMQSLVEAKRVALADWIEILVSVGRDDEGELRGTSARYLESYPDHPGLLLSRSVAELMAGVDLSEFMANVEQMLSASAAEYQIPADEIESSMAWLLGASRRFRPDWAAALWVDWDKAGGPIDSLIQAEDEALADESTSGSELVAVLERRLTRWTSMASQLAERRTE